MVDNAPTVATAKRRIKSLRSLRMPEDKIQEIIRTEFPKDIFAEIYNGTSSLSVLFKSKASVETWPIPKDETVEKTPKSTAKKQENYKKKKVIGTSNTPKAKKKKTTVPVLKPTRKKTINSYEKLLSKFIYLRSLNLSDSQIKKEILEVTYDDCIASVNHYLRSFFALTPEEFMVAVKKSRRKSKNAVPTLTRNKKGTQTTSSTQLVDYKSIMAFERTVEAKKTGPSYEQFEYGISDWDN